MTHRLCLTIAAVALTTLVACGSTPTPVSVGSASGQAAQAAPGGQAARGEDCGARNDGVDRSDKDGVTPGAAFTGHTVDYANLPLDEVLAGYHAVTVLRVTDRDHPRVLPGRTDVAYRTSDAVAEPALPQRPATATNNIHVARPVTFATDRAIKGNVGPCNTLIVPGGSAKDSDGQDRSALNEQYPDKIKVGDRYLALWTATGGEQQLVVTLMLPVDQDGVVTHPFSGYDNKINVNTYQPSAVALRVPAPRSGRPEIAGPDPDIPAVDPDIEATVEAQLPSLPRGSAREDLRKHEEKRNELRERLRADKAKGGPPTTIR